MKEKEELPKQEYNLNIKKAFFWLTVIFLMVLIFKLSSQPAATSNQLSKGVTEVVVDLIEKVTPAEPNVADLNHIVRKYAHFFAYLLLGGLVSVAMNYDVKGKKRITITIIFCVLYAISDEIHQIFVPGRGPQVKDVLIDSAGALIGILMFEIYLKIKKMV